MNQSQVVQLKTMFDTPEPARLGPEPREGRKSVDELARGLDAIFGKNSEHNAIRSLLLLWHDHLDESHTISQDIHTVDGSFIHGIMHRREPDFGNARYWFNRVGRHPAFPEIASRAIALKAAPAEQKVLDPILKNRDWNPFAFIDACEHARRTTPSAEGFLRALQQLEFTVLLEHLSVTQ